MSVAPHINLNRSAPIGDAVELIAFRVGAQEFCVDIMSVREIRGWTPTTPLPHAPSFIRGVVNLRGVAIPVIDLNERLGLDLSEPGPQHVIIVVHVGSEVAGLLVNGVSDIITARDAMIQPVPPVASGRTRNYVQGLLTVDSRMVSLLRTNQLLSDTTALAA